MNNTWAPTCAEGLNSQHSMDGIYYYWIQIASFLKDTVKKLNFCEDTFIFSQICYQLFLVNTKSVIIKNILDSNLEFSTLCIVTLQGQLKCFAYVTEEWFVFSLLLKQTASRDFYDEIYSNCVFLIHELTIHIYVYVKDKGILVQMA